MGQNIDNSLAIIPARAGSKSIKNKNIKLFNGKPLIAWTIKQALASNLTRVIVTTDSEEIKEIAVKYGAEVPYLRDENLSNDTVGIEPVIIDVLDYLKTNESYTPDCIALLMPTSPFRNVSDINKSLEIYQSTGATSVVSVSEATANNNPYWMLKKDNENNVVLFTGQELSEIKTKRQDLPEVFIRNDFVYMLNPENLYLEKPGLYGCNVELMKASNERMDIDINTEMDWKVAEVLFRGEIK
jgi:CMP-N-acetylneuraminic acid synthetase